MCNENLENVRTSCCGVLERDDPRYAHEEAVLLDLAFFGVRGMFVLCWPRGEGQTITATIRLAFHALVRPNRACLVVCNDVNDVDVMQYIYGDVLRAWEKAGRTTYISKEKRGKVLLTNGSSIYFRRVPSSHGVLASISGFHMHDNGNLKALQICDAATKCMPEVVKIVEGCYYHIRAIVDGFFGQDCYQRLAKTGGFGRWVKSELDDKLFINWRNEVTHPWTLGKLSEYETRFLPKQFAESFKNMPYRYYVEEEMQGGGFIIREEHV